MGIEQAILIFLGALIVAVITIVVFVEIKKKNKQSERNRIAREFFNPVIEDIRIANNTFETLVDKKKGYFNLWKLQNFENEYLALYRAIKGKPYKGIDLNAEDVNTIGLFLERYSKGGTIRKKYNKNFVPYEVDRCKALFDHIEGRKLDMQQRIATVTDEDNNLVIAGAGSGKTTTIVGKIKYVTNELYIQPENILLISFTNKSTEDLADRVGTPGVQAKTFHKLGSDIIAKVEGEKRDVFDANYYSVQITGFFNKLLTNDSYLKKLNQYFQVYMKPYKEASEFNSQREYIQYLKDQKCETLKKVKNPANGLSTLRREIVKSMEERIIADFLYINGIEYEYEFAYEHKTATPNYRQYRPDFTILDGDRRVYLEHFAIGKNGQAPPWFGRVGSKTGTEVYREGIEWKRNLHSEMGTTLIETYSFEMSDGVLLLNLERKLNELGVQLQERSQAEIWEMIKEGAEQEIGNLKTLFGTFISLMKSNKHTINQIRTMNRGFLGLNLSKRDRAFLDILEPVYEMYENFLKKENMIDFNDMINLATEYVQSGQFKKCYNYIIIDEFQDISVGRYKLIQALKMNNSGCKLYCVGDDWQSIYRFAGSDISLFKNFEKYFGETVKSKIETTYRFNDPLLTISSKFIQKNPNQEKKDLKGPGGEADTELEVFYSSDQNDTPEIKRAFDSILKMDDNLGANDVVVIGRYSFDIQRINNTDNLSVNNTSRRVVYRKMIDGTQRVIDAQFMTVHKSKGLGAKYIIVINCNSGKFGFPSEMTDDPVLNLLLSSSEQFENEEERRLFYVAITRAKKRVFLIADKIYKSKFIVELENAQQLDDSRNRCPNCQIGDVKLRKTTLAKNGRTRKFYSCSNYKHGCTYENVEWLN